MIINTKYSSISLCSADGQTFSWAIIIDNLILLVTQNLIGSFDFSEVLYIVCCNLPWCLVTMHSIFVASTILVHGVMQNPLFRSSCSSITVEIYFTN
jgi:hypothetical protein